MSMLRMCGVPSSKTKLDMFSAIKFNNTIEEVIKKTRTCSFLKLDLLSLLGRDWNIKQIYDFSRTYNQMIREIERNLFFLNTSGKSLFYHVVFLKLLYYKEIKEDWITAKKIWNESKKFQITEDIGQIFAHTGSWKTRATARIIYVGTSGEKENFTK